MTFKLQLEDKIFVDAVLLRRSGHSVPQQWQASQWEVVPVRFVKEQAKVGKDDPELLPTVAILEFPQEKSAKLVLKRTKRMKHKRVLSCSRLRYVIFLMTYLKRPQLIGVTYARVPMPTNVHGRVASLRSFRTSATRSVCLQPDALAHLVGRACKNVQFLLERLSKMHRASSKQVENTYCKISDSGRAFSDQRRPVRSPCLNLPTISPFLFRC